VRGSRPRHCHWTAATCAALLDLCVNRPEAARGGAKRSREGSNLRPLGAGDGPHAVLLLPPAVLSHLLEMVHSAVQAQRAQQQQQQPGGGGGADADSAGAEWVALLADRVARIHATCYHVSE
jgi:hypothetical protein